MSSGLAVDLFGEDHAHEALLPPLVQRIAAEEGMPVSIRVRRGRGGHGRAIEEWRLYQRLVSRSASGGSVPDLVIVGIDGNCSSFAHKRREIREATEASFADRLVTACPDPHVERWYLADPTSFAEVVGHRPTIAARRKCARDYYKDALARGVRQAGHVATLGGLEFARDIAERMDLYRAGRNDRSLKAFFDDLRKRLRMLRTPRERPAG